MLINNVPFAPNLRLHPPPKKDNPAKDAICHQCGEVGHWRRNCPVYLTELMKKKKLPQGASASVLLDYALETAARILNMVPSSRSTRTRRPTDQLCLYIDTEEHELGDLGEPANYRAALLDPESKKWLDHECGKCNP
ncbi:zinc finger, CCHC-type containing protein [Tanacetum coccineum]|uniref:Zinc finger, CCHC-type containing protein n=1 Tax=Tanacetum coccineum TaxID=301880 RepID=A0ABQ5H646_9ASTR